MNKYLFNPFKYIAGWESIAAGIAVLLLTSGIGYFSNIHFPDVISVKTTSGMPFYVLLIQGFSNWLVFSTLLYIAAKIVSSSSVRAVDVFGTQALARFPYIFAALTGFSESITKFGNYMIWNALHIGDPVQISSGETMFAVLLLLISILLTIWMIALMFNAFKISANLKGSKLVVIFIVAIIVSILITGLASNYLLKPYLTMP